MPQDRELYFRCALEVLLTDRTEVSSIVKVSQWRGGCMSRTQARFLFLPPRWKIVLRLRNQTLARVVNPICTVFISNGRHFYRTASRACTLSRPSAWNWTASNRSSSPSSPCPSRGTCWGSLGSYVRNALYPDAWLAYVLDVTPSRPLTTSCRTSTSGQAHHGHARHPLLGYQAISPLRQRAARGTAATRSICGVGRGRQ